MATTVEVSTWAELVAAVTTAAESVAWQDTTVKLIADIDLNDTDATGVCCQTNFGAYAIVGATTGIVIDGGYIDSETGKQKSHVIKNARTDTSNPRPIFYLNDGLVSDRYGKYITFKNLDFQNLILSTQPFVWFRTDNITTGGYGVRLENCRFCGNRGNTYLFFSNNNLTCENCYFDMPWNGAGQSNLAYTSLIPKDNTNATGAVANYCRFTESYGNWTWADDLTYESADRYFSCSYFKMSGCRIEGDAQICGVTDSNDKGAYYMPIICKGNASYVPATQNVFDVSLVAVRNSATYDTDNVLYSSFNGVVKKDVKYNGAAVTTFTDNRVNFDGGTYTAPILATPEQMKDAPYLNSQGFDIIVR